MDNLRKRAIFVTFGADDLIKKGGTYHGLFPFFMKGIIKAKDHFDKLFILDSDWGLREEDKALLNKEIGPDKYLIETYKKYREHWENLAYLREIHFDQILVLDNDTIIYNPDVIKTFFALLEEKPGVFGILDSSGSFELTYNSIFDANDIRGTRHRICPYLSFISRVALDKTDYDFKPRKFLSGFSVKGIGFLPKEGDWADTMGWISLQLLQNDIDFPIRELPDDRRSLYFDSGGKHTASHNLDSPPFVNNPGYYHIRNFFGAYYLISAKKNYPDTYADRKNTLTPIEALRLLAWNAISIPEIREDCLGIVSDYGISRDAFENYILAMFNYHDWLKDY